MERIEFANGLEMSRLVYGLWRLDQDDCSTGHIRAKLQACLDQGITTMDTADIYGGYRTEEIFGSALRGSGLRDRMEIVTKCDIVAPMGRYADRPVKHYDTSRAHILSSVDMSLKLMGLDHIDLLLIHRPDPFMDADETGSALDEVVASGKVRAVGVSNFRPWDMDLLQGSMRQPLVTNQIEFSLTHNGALTDGDMAYLQRKRIPPMAWSPLGGGSLLTGTHAAKEALDRVAKRLGSTPDAVAIAWILAHPARVLPVMGTNNMNRIKALSDAAKVKIDRETWFDLYTAALGHDVA